MGGFGEGDRLREWECRGCGGVWGRGGIEGVGVKRVWEGLGKRRD